MKEIEANKQVWGQLSQDHYQTFKQALQSGKHKFNPYIKQELGDLSGKKVIHLQCNTGADTLLLAKTAASVVGVDLVPDNIKYAKQLAEDLGATNVEFIECDIMQLMETHSEKYDVVFTSEGAIGWLPDLEKWGRTIRHLLKDDGFFYVFDSHPFFLMWNTDKLAKGEMQIEFPYFKKTPDVDDAIGGYAGERKEGVEAYFWMYTISDIVNSLAKAGLCIEFLNEYEENFYNPDGVQPAGEDGLFNYAFNKGCFPMSFSLKAKIDGK